MGTTMVEQLDAELSALFDEMRRLVVEAAQRAEAGEILPALSSLAAVPTIHHVLMDRCAQELHEGDDGNGDDMVHGCYL